MTANQEDLTALARAIAAARESGTAIEQVAAAAGLDLEEAYAVQLLDLDRARARGERLVGLKLGFTSKEKAEQMGVSDVILGFLTDGLRVADGGTLALERLIHPRIEPEVAFLLSADAGALDLADPGVDLLDHVTHVAPAMEIIDSRFRNFSFSLHDVVADNTSACRFVTGPWVDLTTASERLDLADLRVRLEIDGEAAAEGSTAVILGDPREAPGMVQRLAATYGHPVTGGAVLLAGAATAAVALDPGVTVRTTIEGLGSVSLRIARLPEQR